MRILRFPTVLLLPSLIAFSTCLAGQDNPLERIIQSHRDSFAPWVNYPDSFEVRVMFSRIQRRADGSVYLDTHYWGADSTEYFYPASTVKMPVAALALQKLNELGVLGMDAHTPMFHGPFMPETSATDGSSTTLAQPEGEPFPSLAVSRDTSSQTGLPTVGHYIRKVFLTSDNDAYNRLFEWLGPTYINKSLREAGVKNARIQHRVGLGPFNDITHTYLNPVRFMDGYRELYQIGERRDDYYDPLPAVGGQQRGVGFIRGDTLNEGPFDFRRKNYLSIRNLHDILVKIVLPEATDQPFQLTESDYALMRNAMSQLPRESDYPRYNKPDNYVKFWIYGDQPEEARIPDNVRIFNKVGWAYGYLTDAAYITDGEVEFILVGTIHTNANRIFNDGEYEFEEVGMPFFGRLGRAMLRAEREALRD
jgi:beta-lactamase class A